MINRDTRKLREQVRDAYIRYKSSSDLEEKLALMNYLSNLYESIICMGDIDVEVNKYRSFGGKKGYCKFLDKLDDYSLELIKKYLQDKNFHNAYIGEILTKVEEEIPSICNLSFERDSKLSKKEFFEILSQFMESINQKELFDNFYRKGKIYSSLIGEDESDLGFTIYNPLSEDTDVFVKNLKYDFNSMNTLAHEFGHAYDLQKFKGNVKDYNHYFYTSFYGEVISRLYERLLIRFLIKNGIHPNDAKESLIYMELTNHDYLLEAYVFSVLKNRIIKDDKYMDYNPQELAHIVRKEFLEIEDITEFLERMGELDLSECYNYAYGDIISMFLCEDVEKSGFNVEIIDYFFKNRDKLFSKEFLSDAEMSPKNYLTQYKKEIELLKR